MSDEITVVDATEALEPPPTGAIYAWVPRDDRGGGSTRPACHRAPRSVVAVAVLAVFAAIAVVTEGVVVLLTPMRTDQYDLRPLPVQAAPAPPKAAPAPAPKAAPPPAAMPARVVVVQPPVAAPVVPPPAAPPADANQRFSRSLARGNMWQQPDANDDQQARSMCADLAAGGSVQPYIDGTERKSPQLLPAEARQAVEDAQFKPIARNLRGKAFIRVGPAGTDIRWPRVRAPARFVAMLISSSRLHSFSA